MKARLVLLLLLAAGCASRDSFYAMKHEGGGGVIDADLLEVKITRPMSRIGTLRQMTARVEVSNVSSNDVVVKKIQLDQRGIGSGVMLETAITAFRESIAPGQSHEFTVYGRGQVDMDAADLPQKASPTLFMRCTVTLEDNQYFIFDFEIPYEPEMT